MSGRDSHPAATTTEEDPPVTHPAPAAVDYPDAELDAQRAAAAGFAPEVAARLLGYVAALNLRDKVDSADGPFPRHRYFRLADPTGRAQRYLRVGAYGAIGEVDSRIGSIEAYVEIATGLVYKADGPRPAKGARYSLATAEDADKLVRVAGQPYYLYR